MRSPPTPLQRGSMQGSQNIQPHSNGAGTQTTSWSPSTGSQPFTQSPSQPSPQTPLRNPPALDTQEPTWHQQAQLSTSQGLRPTSQPFTQSPPQPSPQTPLRTPPALATQESSWHQQAHLPTSQSLRPASQPFTQSPTKSRPQTPLPTPAALATQDPSWHQQQQACSQSLRPVSQPFTQSSPQPNPKTAKRPPPATEEPYCHQQAQLSTSQSLRPASQLSTQSPSNPGPQTLMQTPPAFASQEPYWHQQPQLSTSQSLRPAAQFSPQSLQQPTNPLHSQLFLRGHVLGPVVVAAGAPSWLQQPTNTSHSQPWPQGRSLSPPDVSPLQSQSTGYGTCAHQSPSSQPAGAGAPHTPTPLQPLPPQGSFGARMAAAAALAFSQESQGNAMDVDASAEAGPCGGARGSPEAVPVETVEGLGAGLMVGPPEGAGGTVPVASSGGLAARLREDSAEAVPMKSSQEWVWVPRSGEGDTLAAAPVEAVQGAFDRNRDCMGGLGKRLGRTKAQRLQTMAVDGWEVLGVIGGTGGTEQDIEMSTRPGSLRAEIRRKMEEEPRLN